VILYGGCLNIVLYLFPGYIRQ